MTDVTSTFATDDTVGAVLSLNEPSKPSASRITRTATVVRLLSRSKGATLSEIGSSTAWQLHSCRSFLTGLRKKGVKLLKEARRDGETCYRIAC